MKGTKESATFKSNSQNEWETTKMMTFRAVQILQSKDKYLLEEAKTNGHLQLEHPLKVHNRFVKYENKYDIKDKS